jgi:O-antigen/teichoic acid export membrane protein
MSLQSETGSPPKKATERNSFIFNIIIVMGGTSIGALITVVATPIITRYFTPDAFGIFAVFSSIVSILSIIACMRYEAAIMLPKSDEEAINIFALGLLIAFLLSSLLLPVFFFFQSQIIALFNLPSLGSYILIIPLMVFINGVFTSLYYWNTRKKNFKRLAGARITTSVVTNGSQLGSAFIGFVTAGGLIIGSILGTLASTIVLALQIWRFDLPVLKSNIRWSSMVHSLRRYRNFPIFDTFSAFLNNLSWQLPVFMLAAFFSPTIVGYYSLGLMVLFFPMNLIGSSLSQNFFQKAVESKEQGTLGQLVEQVFAVLVTVGLYPIFLLTLVGANVFIVIFGPAWGEAGVYLQILSIWAFVWFVSSPLSGVFAVLEKQAYSLKLNIAIFSTRFGSLLIGGLLGNPLLALGLFAGTGIFVYGYMNWSIMRFAGSSLVFVRTTLIHNFILFIPAGILILFIKFITVNNYVITFASLLILLAYYAYLLKTNERIKGIFNQITGGLIRG